MSGTGERCEVVYRSKRCANEADVIWREHPVCTPCWEKHCAEQKHPRFNFEAIFKLKGLIWTCADRSCAEAVERSPFEQHKDCPRCARNMLRGERPGANK